MPRSRRRRRARRGSPTKEQWLELMWGPGGLGGHSEPAFASDAERKALWMEYCWELKSEWDPEAVFWGEREYGLPGHRHPKG